MLELAVMPASEVLPRERSDNADLVSLCVAVMTHLEKGMAPGQSPGHAHRQAGVWDKGNRPELAGQPCTWCETWNGFRNMVNVAQQAKESQLERFRTWIAGQCSHPEFLDLREYPADALRKAGGPRFLNPSIERDWHLWQAALGIVVE